MDANGIDIDDIRLVSALARSGGAREAAERLATHPATVYRRLAVLQAKLGRPLFEKADGRYVPTALAAEILALADDFEGRLAELHRRLAREDDRLSGVLKVTTTDSLLPLVSEICVAFRAEHPGLGLELLVSNAFADLARYEAEVAIRPTTSPPESLVGRRAATFDYAVYARPDAPECWIGLDQSLAGIPSARWLAERVDPREVAVRVNSMWAAAAAAGAGLGRALLPTYLAFEHPVERLAGPFPEIASEVWVLTHPDLRRTPRIRAFSEAAANALRRKLRERAG
jgi:DNA-binding transcriptional LysR family regulator